MITAGYLALVLVALSCLLLGIKSLQTRELVGAESARKLMHVGMGLICFPLPWCFPTVIPVIGLAAAAATVLVVVRFVPSANRKFGTVLGGTGRVSLGEFYFPLGIMITFVLGEGNRAAYFSAVGVLAFADTAGALVGTRIGKMRYTIRGNHKSIEGSTAVLLTSILWVALMIEFFSPSSWRFALAGAFAVASVATVIEALSWRGLDNVLVPVSVVSLMQAWGYPAAGSWLLRVSCGVGIIAGCALLATAAGGRIRLRVRQNPLRPASD